MFLTLALQASILTNPLLEMPTLEGSATPNTPHTVVNIPAEAPAPIPFYKRKLFKGSAIVTGVISFFGIMTWVYESMHSANPAIPSIATLDQTLDFLSTDSVTVQYASNLTSNLASSLGVSAQTPLYLAAAALQHNMGLSEIASNLINYIKTHNTAPNICSFEQQREAVAAQLNTIIQERDALKAQLQNLETAQRRSFQAQDATSPLAIQINNYVSATLTSLRVGVKSTSETPQICNTNFNSALMNIEAMMIAHGASGVLIFLPPNNPPVVFSLDSAALPVISSVSSGGLCYNSLTQFPPNLLFADATAAQMLNG